MPNTPKIKLTKQGRTRGADYVAPAPLQRFERRGPGAPTKYDERVTIATACAAARHGATDEEIAHELGITVSTLYLWYGAHVELSEAVKAAKAACDDRMERRLYSRGMGYKQEVEKVFSNGNRITVVEEVAPDTTAQIFWLKNRKRMDWRDTREIDLVVPDNGPQTEDLDTRSLALAAINLLSDASTDPDAGRTTLDLEPNSTEEVDDDDADSEEPDHAQGRAQDRQPRKSGRRSQPEEDFDPDFDL